MKVMMPIAITLVILFLAANVGILYKFGGRFSGNSPNARNTSKFAEEAERGLDAFRRADFDQAIVAFDELIRLRPFHSEAYRWRGDASLNKHEFDKALTDYDEAIRMNSKNWMAYCGRGAALTEKGEFDKAIASFDEAVWPRSGDWRHAVLQTPDDSTESLRPNPQSPKFVVEPNVVWARSSERITIKPSMRI